MTRRRTDPLLEREGELVELRDRLAAARGGAGSVVVIEGPSGVGKTALLATARDLARGSGLTVLATREEEVEREFPWGVVRDLFGPALEVSRAERRELLSGAARLSALALDSPGTGIPRPPPGADAMAAALHGLYWLAANLAARSPMLVAVDDAGWADVASLRWLAYLAARIEDLPVLLVVVVGVPAEPGTQEQLLSSLTFHSAATLRPSALSETASTELVRGALGADVAEELAAACHAATGGNPLLLAALLDELRARGAGPTAAAVADVHEIESQTISRVILLRLRRLTPDARRLCAAIAVLGRGPFLPETTALAGLDEASAVRAADALAGADVIGPTEPLEFIQPIVRTTVYSQIPSHDRRRLHGRAAELLDSADAPAEVIAKHLLYVEPRGRPALVDVLAAAADTAVAGGAPEAAIAYLERALDEPPSEPQRPRILRRLGNAGVSLQRPEAVEHLRDALELSDDRRERAQVTRELAVPLLHSGQIHESVGVLEKSIAEMAGTDRELRLELEADLIGAARVHADLREMAVARALGLRDAQLKGRTFGERVALAAVAGEADAVLDTAEGAIDCAERALGRGWLLAEAGPASPSLWYAASALIVAEAFETAAAVIDDALAEARAKGSMIGSALGFCFRALLGYRTGHLVAAEADARHAIELTPTARWAPRIYAVAFLVDILLDRGPPDVAAEAVTRSGVSNIPRPLLPMLILQQNRGRLRIALGDHAGLEDVRVAAHGLKKGGVGPCMWPWRTFLALALAGEGDREEARRLAQEEAALTRPIGAHRAFGISLRAAGIVEGGDRGIEMLQEAVAVLDGSPAVLEHARALVDLGSALRRAGHRRDALHHLREGLDLASRCGAGAVAARARAEIVAAGAKPRRDAVHGRDALTASELRVARMAAEGMTNRDIAQALFVSLRTVETHLTHAYHKLSVSSRDELSTTVGPDTPDDKAGADRSAPA